MGVVLEAERIGFAYPGRAPTFRDLSLAVSDGEILCVLGPNGVGKSTLLNCLCGQAAPTYGAIRLDGRPMGGWSLAEVARRLAMVPQSHVPVFAFPVRTVVEMGRAPHLGWFAAPRAEDQRIAAAALEELGIGHLADRAFTEISGGERQLVMLARVLAQEPKLVILDEPTAHLDFANQALFLALMRRLAGRGLAVIFTTHAPDHAFTTADQTLLMARGQPPAVGPAREVLTEAALSAAYGAPVRIVTAGRHVMCSVDLDGQHSAAHPA